MKTQNPGHCPAWTTERGKSMWFIGQVDAQLPAMNQGFVSPSPTLMIRICCPNRLSTEEKAIPCYKGLGNTCIPLAPCPRFLLRLHSSRITVPLAFTTNPIRAKTAFLWTPQALAFSSWRMAHLLLSLASEKPDSTLPNPHAPPQLESASIWLLTPWLWSLRPGSSFWANLQLCTEHFCIWSLQFIDQESYDLLKTQLVELPICASAFGSVNWAVWNLFKPAVLDAEHSCPRDASCDDLLIGPSSYFLRPHLAGFPGLGLIYVRLSPEFF